MNRSLWHVLFLTLVLGLWGFTLGGCKLDDNRLKGSIRGLPSGGPPPGNLLPPQDLSYLTLEHYYSQEMLSLEPSVTGDVTHYSIEPELPEGLALNTQTGEISGTLPPLPRTTYTVTAHNAAGSVNFAVELVVHFKAVVNKVEDQSDEDLGDGICQVSQADGDGCSLRAALEQANALKPLPARIEVPVGDYELTLGTSLEVGTSLQLIGAGPSETRILRPVGADITLITVAGDVEQLLVEGLGLIGDGTEGLFRKGLSGTVGGDCHWVIRNLEVKGHNSSSAAGMDIYMQSFPLIDRSLVIEDSVFTDNECTNRGCGVGITGLFGQAMIRRTRFQNNSFGIVGGMGAGLYVGFGSGTLFVEDSQFLDNKSNASFQEGAIYLDSRYGLNRIVRTTFSNNEMEGIYARSLNAPFEVENVTFSGNQNYSVYVRMDSVSDPGTLKVVNSTFRDSNHHIYIRRVPASLANNIFAGAITASCELGVEGEFSSLGGNVDEDNNNSCNMDTAMDATDSIDSGPLLFDVDGLKYQTPESLTQTIGLDVGSPALTHGVADHCPEADQDGNLRPSGAACDAGALQVSPGS